LVFVLLLAIPLVQKFLLLLKILSFASSPAVASITLILVSLI
jgi:hypothetical protein